METKIEEPFLKISMKDWKAHDDGLFQDGGGCNCIMQLSQV
ncbi:hypothetical protein HanXRQr2_Chr04g0149611 [Helianthus annuus]|uniref:Uncharacterized protein n=1 Tax=Helianthus annuus TaxID=4232 RepID=A0A9K3J4W3_HELAN|nr:hypothetical protein HanXRQr2_Chr04g0149611 [Helianthus annuus]